MKRKTLYLILTVFLVITVTVISIGVSFARFTSNVPTDISVSPSKPYNVSFFNSEGKSEAPYWTKSGDNLVSAFSITVTSENAEKDSYRILFYSDTELSASLVVDGVEYTAVASPIDEKSVLYSEFGPGYIYRFYYEGAEWLWQLKNTDNDSSKKDLSIILKNASDRVFISEINIDNAGK